MSKASNLYTRRFPEKTPLAIQMSSSALEQLRQLQQQAETYISEKLFNDARLAYKMLGAGYLQLEHFAPALDAQNILLNLTPAPDKAPIRKQIEDTFAKWHSYAEALLSTNQVSPAYNEYAAILERFPEDERAQKNMNEVLKKQEMFAQYEAATQQGLTPDVLLPTPPVQTWQERTSPKPATAQGRG